MNPPPPTEKLSDAPRVKFLRGAPLSSSYRTHYTQPINTSPKSGSILAGWVMLLIGFFLACIPFLGLLMWWLGIFFCFTAFIFGIIGAAQGRVFAGCVLIVGSFTVAPAIYFLAPIVSALLFG